MRKTVPSLQLFLINPVKQLPPKIKGPQIILELKEVKNKEFLSFFG